MTSGVTSRAPIGGSPADPGALPSIADEVLAKAEAAVARLAAEYPRHARRDLEHLRSLAERMGRERHARAAHYSEIARIAHDMRGQGTLFGQPMMTRCAASLCRAARNVEAHDPSLAGIVRLHLAALQAILDAGPVGRRDPVPVAIVAGLGLLVGTRLPARKMLAVPTAPE